MTTTTATTTSVTTTTTASTTSPATPNAVLVLSTLYPSNKPIVVTFDGKIFIYLHISFFDKSYSGVINDNIDFEYESGTEAYYGCGVTLKGQFWYLGGISYKRQVNKHI